MQDSKVNFQAREVNNAFKQRGQNDPEGRITEGHKLTQSDIVYIPSLVHALTDIALSFPFLCRALTVTRY